jgi:TM2 domain-containing membrane protein YozV
MAWQSAQRPYVPPPAGGPSPALAALLGAIPGVGAMYNGQFVKGMVHVVIFAVLVSTAHVYGVFGIFIAAWIFYQMFEAYHTARARRDGDPLPDPLGLNEVSNWFTTGGRQQQGPPPGAAATAQTVNPETDAMPHQSAYRPPYQAPYQAPYAPPPPGFAGPAYPPIPPMPPVPPEHWRRREPIGAVILIVLGVMFLLGQFNWFSWRVYEYLWPLLLIGLGVWLIVRRLQDAQGRPPAGPQNGSQDSSRGGQK